MFGGFGAWGSRGHILGLGFRICGFRVICWCVFFWFWLRQPDSAFLWGSISGFKDSVRGSLGPKPYTLTRKLSEGSHPSSDRPRTLGRGPEHPCEKRDGKVRVKPHRFRGLTV